MKLLSLLLNGVIMVIVVVFLVANRQLVAISLDPVRIENPALATPALPLWFWLITALLIGFFLGATGMWMSGRPKRVQAREDRRAVAALTRENEILAARATVEPPTIVAEEQ